MSTKIIQSLKDECAKAAQEVRECERLKLHDLIKSCGDAVFDSKLCGLRIEWVSGALHVKISTLNQAGIVSETIYCLHEEDPLCSPLAN